MVEIHFVEGRSCPVIVCDMCGERLSDPGKAAAVFANFGESGGKVRALLVHKGKIDGRTCHEEAEALIRKEGGNAGWHEMKAFLADLVHNAGFPAKELADYVKRQHGTFEP
jgi:hypothetical protein